MNPSPEQPANDRPQDGAATAGLISCIEELSRRPARQPDFAWENLALVALMHRLADSPQTILQSLAQTILVFLDAGSAGVSLLSNDGTRFVWPAIAGQWKEHVNSGLPRDASPCGKVVDANAPLLFQHPETQFNALKDVEPKIIETLLVPVHVKSKVVGTIWVISHREDRRFDNEDLRQLLALGSFASAAFQAVARMDTTAQQSDALRQGHSDLQDIQERLRMVNEALIIKGMSQHELAERTQRLNDQLRDEIGQRQSVEAELRNLNATLEQRIMERTSEAQRRTSQLQALAVQLTQVENRERRRLAQVLHDHLQQLLVGAKMRLSFFNSDVPMEADRKHLTVVREVLDEAIACSRTLTAELSPAVLFNSGLAAGLAWLARSMREKHDFEVEVVIGTSAKLDNPDMDAFLFQAARELLFNAIKHANTKKARVELRSLGLNIIELIVQDHGQGFDPERNAGLEGRAGTGHPEMGFGLMSIRERLDALGGRMLIESVPGKGSRFSLTLPIRRQTASSAAPVETQMHEAAVRRPDTGKIRVLVVDDHKLVRQELVRLFAKRADIEVVGEAITGEDALKQAAILQPDVALMDVNMPEMGGIEATRRLTAEHPSVGVIGLSMHTASEVANEMRLAGAVDFLSKDGPPAALIAAIQRCSPTKSAAR